MFLAIHFVAKKDLKKAFSEKQDGFIKHISKSLQSLHRLLNRKYRLHGHLQDILKEPVRGLSRNHLSAASLLTLSCDPFCWLLADFFAKVPLAFFLHVHQVARSKKS